MKTFKDLEKFSTDLIFTRLRLMFDNWYGVSVVKWLWTYWNEEWLRELAVVRTDWRLCYETPITNDVIGYLTENGVTRIMREIQNLPSTD